MHTPKYRHQKSTGRALVEINGRRIYLGKFGSAESKARYKQELKKWAEDRGRSAPAADMPSADALIKDLIWAHWQHVTTYYVKHGRRTSEQAGIRSALKRLRRLYGDQRAAEFGLAKLETYRQEMIDEGLRLTTINQHVGRVIRAFRWGAEREMLPAEVWHRLLTVKRLKRGRTRAKDPRDVRPVPDSVLDELLPHLSPVVAAMVRFQRLTGCRPGEVCSLRPGDIDRGTPEKKREVWLYVPKEHKTEHHGKQRHIYIGPRAQEVLLPWLNRGDEEYCFSPREAVESAGDLLPIRPRPGRRRAHYDNQTYRQGIIHGLTRLAKAKGHEPPVRKKRKSKRTAGVDEKQKPPIYQRPTRQWFESVGLPYFHPNQVRHTAATQLRAAYGNIEAARTVLGHKDSKITDVYAERDFARAEEIMRQMG